MALEVFRISDGSFIGDRGDAVEGKNYYLVSDNGQEENERVFISDERAARLGLALNVGDKVIAFRDRATHRVVELLPAK